MENRPDNPPAFPGIENNNDDHIPEDYGYGPEISGGMSLRDYFAAKSMASLEVSWKILISTDKWSPPDDWQSRIAKTAYDQADEMLKVREATK